MSNPVELVSARMYWQQAPGAPSPKPTIRGYMKVTDAIGTQLAVGSTEDHTFIGTEIFSSDHSFTGMSVPRATFLRFTPWYTTISNPQQIQLRPLNTSQTNWQTNGLFKQTGGTFIQLQNTDMIDSSATGFMTYYTDDKKISTDTIGYNFAAGGGVGIDADDGQLYSKEMWFEDIQANFTFLVDFANLRVSFTLTSQHQTSPSVFITPAFNSYNYGGAGTVIVGGNNPIYEYDSEGLYLVEITSDKASDFATIPDSKIIAVDLRNPNVICDYNIDPTRTSGKTTNEFVDDVGVNDRVLNHFASGNNAVKVGFNDASIPSPSEANGLYRWFKTPQGGSKIEFSQEVNPNHVFDADRPSRGGVIIPKVITNTQR